MNPSQEPRPNPPQSDSGLVAMRVKRLLVVLQLDGKFHVERPFATDKRYQPENELGPVEVTQSEEGLEVVLEYSLKLTAVDASSEEEPASDGKAENADFSAVARFVALYELEGEEPLPDEALGAFGAINGRLNTLPYWREFAQSCCVRGGFPPYAVPVFNPHKIAEQLASRSSDDPAGSAQD